MKYRHCISFLLLAAALLASSMAPAQISHGGSPRYNRSLPKGATTPVVVATTVDNGALLEEDMAMTATGSPTRIGVATETAVSIPDSAVRLPQTDGSTVFRLAIASPGAYFMSLTFDEYDLPDGAELYLYDATGRFVIGRFLASDAQDDGSFYTQALPGDLCYVEYRVPARAPSAGRLHLSGVTHGYKELFDGLLNPMESDGGAEHEAMERLREKGVIGNDGGCSPDVACAAGDGWCHQIGSVACYTLLIGGYSYICSGALINNTRNDKTPYFLSAYHCQAEGTVSQWTFYFNYQASSCNAADGPATHTMTGATIRAKYETSAGSDFLLLELRSAVPESYKPYFAGWSRASADITVGCCIHHPAGDEKKISIPATVSSSTGTYAKYLRADWDNHGVVEGGSSGSPLFNKNGLIIGQLYGGNSSCTNTYGNDYYGAISVSWTGGGSSTSRLKDWLDPTGSDVTSLGGDGSLDSCDTDSTAIVVVDTSISALRMWPNPTDGERFHVQADDSGSAVYYVFSMDGRLMKSGEMVFTATEQPICLADLHNGAYYVEVVVGDHRYGNIVVVSR